MLLPEGYRRLVDGWIGLQDEIRALNWAGYAVWPSTESYVPSHVPTSFSALALVRSRRRSLVVYDQLMNTLAHNHSGWVYAAAAPGSALLARAARALDGWARITALEVLTDLTCFAVDISFHSPEGDLIRLDTAVRDAARALRPELDSWQRPARPDRVPTSPGRRPPKPRRRRAFGNLASTAAALLEVLEDDEGAGPQDS
jgi:hypothetical protein